MPPGGGPYRIRHGDRLGGRRGLRRGDRRGADLLTGNRAAYDSVPEYFRSQPSEAAMRLPPINYVKDHETN